jgi:hypothetical protein
MKAFPPHLDARGCVIVPEKSEPLYPQYLIEMGRFWAQYHARLTREHFTEAASKVKPPVQTSVASLRGKNGDVVYLVEFFHRWGTVFLWFMADESGKTRFRYQTSSVTEFNEDESYPAMWKFSDKLDEALFPVTKTK